MLQGNVGHGKLPIAQNSILLITLYFWAKDTEGWEKSKESLQWGAAHPWA